MLRCVIWSGRFFAFAWLLFLDLCFTCTYLSFFIFLCASLWLVEFFSVIITRLSINLSHLLLFFFLLILNRCRLSSCCRCPGRERLIVWLRCWRFCSSSTPRTTCLLKASHVRLRRRLEGGSVRGAVTLWRCLMERFGRNRGWRIIINCERVALVTKELIWVSKNTTLRASIEANCFTNSSRWVDDRGLETAHDTNSTWKNWSLLVHVRASHGLQTTKRLPSTAHTRRYTAILSSVRRVGLWWGTP